MNSAFDQAPLVIRDSPGFNRTVGIALLVFGMVVVLASPENWIVGLALLVGGAGLLARGLRNRIVLEIGPRGIFQMGKLVTDWAHFERAQIKSEEYESRRTEYIHQVLLVDYRHPENGNIYQRKIILDETRNQSDKEIIETIRVFSGQ
ncbi:MAG: hypothetical protein EOO11_18500 [Chitinophagaceae bacterium]|nr:MAG: hypothetical protein EOO11_18500 [Chitinophagaceae bacterium]